MLTAQYLSFKKFGPISAELVPSCTQQGTASLFMCLLFIYTINNVLLRRVISKLVFFGRVQLLRQRSCGDGISLHTDMHFKRPPSWQVCGDTRLPERVQDGRGKWRAAVSEDHPRRNHQAFRRELQRQP